MSRAQRALREDPGRTAISLWSYTVFTNRGHAGKKLVPSHESEALEDKQKLQMKTFSELAQCLERISLKITLYGQGNRMIV